MKKKINTSDLIQKIEKLTKARIASQEVVPLNEFRSAQNKVQPKVLLVIEDDDTMRLALQRIFEPEGFILKMAADSSQLGNVLDDQAIDLILLDIGLPWINGFELAEMLKDHKDLKKIPIVFVSGQTSDGDIKKAFEVGASDFIKKPFDVEKIKKTVHTLLKLNS